MVFCLAPFPPTASSFTSLNLKSIQTALSHSCVSVIGQLLISLH